MFSHEQVLQQQLEALDAGEPLEQVLARLPVESRHLEPLIRLAASVRVMPHPRPQQAAQPAYQRRAAAEAAARYNRVAPPRPRFGFSWGRLALVGGAATAALVLFMAVISLLSMNLWFGASTSARAATLMDVIGQVEVASSMEAQDWRQVSDGSLVRAGQLIRTGSDGSATMVFYEGSRAVLEPNTELVMATVTGGWGKTLKVVMQQLSGQTSHSVVPLRGASSRYWVETAAGVAHVRGTQFEVAVEENGMARIAVSTGEVLVEGAASEVMVASGQVVAAQPGMPFTAPDYQFNHQGVVDAISDDQWVVDGVIFQVGANTLLAGDPQVGAYVQVDGRLLKDTGEVTVDKIEAFPMEVDDSTLTGVIESAGEGLWLIGGTTVLVTGDTEIEGDPGEGDTVQVTFIVLEDGQLQAVKIVSLEEEEPEDLVTETVTTTEAVSATEQVTPTEEVTPTETVTTTAPVTDCVGVNPHPVGARLAARYNVSYDEIMGWFCQHFGFGEIDLAYSLSLEGSLPVSDVFSMKSSGQGWGLVKKYVATLPPPPPPTDTVTGTLETPALSASAAAAPPGKQKSCPGSQINPKVQALAQRVGVTYEEVIGWYCQGFSLAEIKKAYNVSQKTGAQVSDTLALRQKKVNWKKIEQQLNASNQSQYKKNSNGQGQPPQPKNTPKPKPPKKSKP